MPCIDERDSSGYRLEEAGREIRKLRAMLCFSLRAFTDLRGGPLCAVDLFSEIREKKCGVKTTAVLEWWKEHQAADLRREKAKKAKAQKEDARKEALSKLSKKERKLLGLEE